MGEKHLNNVIDSLKKAMAELRIAEAYAREELHDYNVATKVRGLLFKVGDYNYDLDTDYRSLHFNKRPSRR